MSQLGEAPYSVNFLDDDDLARIKSGFKNPDVESSSGIGVLNGKEICNLFLGLLSKNPDQSEWEEIRKNEYIRILKDLEEEDNYLMSFGLECDENPSVLCKYLYETCPDIMWGDDCNLDTLKMKAGIGAETGWLVVCARTSSFTSPLGYVFMKPCGFLLQKRSESSSTSILACFQLLIQHSSAEEVIDIMSRYRWYLVDHVTRGITPPRVESDLPKAWLLMRFPPPGKSEAAIEASIQSVKNTMNQVKLRDGGLLLLKSLRKKQFELERSRYRNSEQISADLFVNQLKEHTPDHLSGIVVEDIDDMHTKYALYLYQPGIDDIKKIAIKKAAAELKSVALEMEDDSSSAASTASTASTDTVTGYSD